METSKLLTCQTGNHKFFHCNSTELVDLTVLFCFVLFCFVGGGLKVFCIE